MTSTMDERGRSAIRAVQEWVAALPPGLATLHETETEMEHILTIRPTNSRAADVEFRVGHDGTADIHFGKAGNFEEVSITPEFLIEVCNAVSSGQLRDRVRCAFGFQVGVTTILDLGHGHQMKDTSVQLAGLLLYPFVPPRDIQYEPWSTALSR